MSDFLNITVLIWKQNEKETATFVNNMENTSFRMDLPYMVTKK